MFELRIFDPNRPAPKPRRRKRIVKAPVAHVAMTDKLSKSIRRVRRKAN
jgi:hypothetical protein